MDRLRSWALALVLVLFAAAEASAQPGIPAARIQVLGTTAADLRAAIDTGELGQHRVSSNCTTESGGAPRELCRDSDDNTLWSCTVSAPSVCNAASWVQVGGGAGGAGDIESVGSCTTGACPGPITFSGGSDETLTADGFIGPGANPADAGAVRLSFGEAVCWENETPGTDLCIDTVATNTIRLGATGAIQVAIVPPLVVQGVNPTLQNSEPQLDFDDLSFSDGSKETQLRAWAPTDDNGSFQINVESGAASYVSMLTVNSNAGASTLYLGGAGGAITTPANAVTIDEAGVLDRIGTGEVRGAYERCLDLRAGDVTCFSANGCAGETLDGTGHSFVSANFATDADDSGSWSFKVPNGWTGATVSVEIEWTSNHADCDNAAADDVCFTFDSGSVADDGAWLAPTLGGAANGQNDTCLANGDLMRATRTGYVHGMTDGQRGIFALTRTVAGTPTGCASADDYTQSAKVLGVRICKE